MNTLKKEHLVIFPSISLKKIILGIVIIFLLLLMTNSSVINFSNNNGNNSIVLAEISEDEKNKPIETDFRKILLPYEEENKTGENLKKGESIKYYGFPKYSEGKIVVAIGQIEGCPNGCFFNNETVCPEACFVPGNWKEEKRFEGTFFKDSYYKFFKKDGDKDTKEFYCQIKKYPLHLLSCFKDFDEKEKTEIIKLDESATVIVLPYLF